MYIYQAQSLNFDSLKNSEWSWDFNLISSNILLDVLYNI